MPILALRRAAVSVIEVFSVSIFIELISGFLTTLEPVALVSFSLSVDDYFCRVSFKEILFAFFLLPIEVSAGTIWALSVLLREVSSLKVSLSLFLDDDRSSDSDFFVSSSTSSFSGNSSIVFDGKLFSRPKVCSGVRLDLGLKSGDSYTLIPVSWPF